MVRSSAPELPLWLRPLVPFERYRVPVDGLHIHVMEVGEGRPVLMVHGNPTWGFLYHKVAARLLGEPLRLIMPDLVGLGFSDKPAASAHTLENHVRWMAAWVQALDLRDVVLVAQDWGGPIGLGAFLDAPDRLTGLVLLNTVVGPPKPGFRPTAFHRFSHLPVVSDVAFRLLGFPQAFLGSVQGDRHSIRGAVARAYRHPLRDRRHNQAPLALARMVPDGPDHPSVPALTRIQAFVEAYRGPAALVWGERDPVLGRLCNRVARLLPQARVVRTDGGHFIQEEHPGPIADAIREVAGLPHCEG
jgi:pimeloyl-ACP methyl ester carboxylesterase